MKLCNVVSKLIYLWWSVVFVVECRQNEAQAYHIRSHYISSSHTRTLDRQVKSRRLLNSAFFLTFLTAPFQLYGLWCKTSPHMHASIRRLNNVLHAPSAILHVSAACTFCCDYALRTSDATNLHNLQGNAE